VTGSLRISNDVGDAATEFGASQLRGLRDPGAGPFSMAIDPRWRGRHRDLRRRLPRRHVRGAGGGRAADRVRIRRSDDQAAVPLRPRPEVQSPTLWLVLCDTRGPRTKPRRRSVRDTRSIFRQMVDTTCRCDVDGHRTQVHWASSWTRAFSPSRTASGDTACGDHPMLRRGRGSSSVGTHGWTLERASIRSASTAGLPASRSTASPSGMPVSMRLARRCARTTEETLHEEDEACCPGRCFARDQPASSLDDVAPATQENLDKAWEVWEEHG
jgi:hypothetical protein